MFCYVKVRTCSKILDHGIFFLLVFPMKSTYLYRVQVSEGKDFITFKARHKFGKCLELGESLWYDPIP